MHRQHTLAQALPLSGVRIAGTSAAIALHAIVLMLLFTPTTWAPPKIEPIAEPLVRPVELPIKQPEAFVDKPKPMTKPDKAPTAKPETKPVASHEAAVDSDTGPQAVPDDNTIHETGESHPPANLIAELSADIAPPPPYPGAALRAGITGLVLLRIQVDAQGHPVSGGIEKSSGSHLLDQAALKFVLAKWHFNPALQSGQPVEAIALVPVSFTID